MKKIITDNLYLRLFRLEDITPEYISALNDKKVIGLTESRYQKWTEEKVRKYVKESNIEGESLLVGVFLKKSDKHIGNIRLHSFSKYNKRVEMGIMIFDKSQWRKGYGTEALKGICDYIFGDFKLNKICAEYYSINKASARIFEKNGFEIEGVLKKHFLVNKKWIDAIRIAKLNKKLYEK